MKNKNYFNNGFTLLEILLVVGIIAILAGIVIVAINPGKQLAMARNTERKSDLKQINSALQQYYIDHREYPTSLTYELTDICNTGSTASSSVEEVYGSGYCNNYIDLSVLVPTYLTAIPKDPQVSSTSSAGYKVIKHSSSGTIGFSALSELGQDININIPEEDLVIEPEVNICDTPIYPECWSAQSPTDLAWGPMPSTTGVSTDTTLSNGEANTAILAGLIGGYPAADYCYNLTEGDVPVGTWYLPSYAELLAGWSAFNSSVFSSDYYWSSTEDYLAADFQSWSLKTSSDNMTEMPKNSQFSVRCLRTILMQTP